MMKRESFVATFGEDQALKFEAAARQHVGRGADRGSNLARDLISAIGGDVPLETEAYRAPLSSRYKDLGLD